MSDADKYKDTVFLPKTDFPMRGELPKREPEILKKWQDMDLYRATRATSAGRPKWVLHDGPPYANGDIHMGHALNKTLKDVVNRFYQGMGYDAPYVPGWDCHGLPIEWKVEEQYRNAGKNKDDVDAIAFRAECRAFAQKWVDTQSAQFQRLGVNGDWANPYLTMTHRAEAGIVREIHKFATNGGLYKGVKPVMWSTVEKTALAEAEVEYKDHKSITVWVKFPVRGQANTFIVIWTTTPWTLPSNRAIAFGDALDYAAYTITAVKDEARAKVGETLILSTKLADDVKAKAHIEEWTQAPVSFDLNKTVCDHPLHAHGYDFDVPVLAGDFVTDDTGTGFVHIAPSHGEDDYWLYMKHFGAKDIPDNVTDDGKFRDHVPLFAGMEVLTEKGEMGGGNFAVLKALDENGALLAKGSIKHDYPHSWRSKAPVIFRTTPQWFIGMNAITTAAHGDNNAPLREKALAAIRDTRWVPTKGEARITAMIENRPDWCISRQRAWGVPIALFVHKETDEVLKDADVLSRIADAFEREGADAWWSHDAQYFLGGQYNPDDYHQVFDIVDVWFESGSTHSFVLGDTKTWPDFEGVGKADLYLEGSDQHRGWFHSSLLESCGTNGVAPYKTVLTHGFVLDDKGYKMSKSLGNVVDPLKMMDEHGADIIRLWTMLSDYSEDIRIGKDTLKVTADLYRRIRNTFRYLLGALDGFDKSEMVPESEYKNMPELEQLVLHWLAEIDGDVRGHIENYEFGRLAHRLHNFCAGELSAFYFDIRKDRLYCDRPDSFERRACRTVMAKIFDCLVTWLAPILAFTAEDAWNYRPRGVFAQDTDSVHLRTFPVIPADWKNEELATKWATLQDIRRVILGALEPKRKDKTIGSSLEAHPVVYLNADMAKLVEGIDLAELSITSQASVKTETAPADAFTLNDVPGVAVVFTRAEGGKCQRSWRIVPDVGSDPEYPDLSARDADAVRWYQQNKKAA
ncbi:isoleucine--tRNA ligase [Micavibrio aeruginosavorus]|uniref:Isoleucine--tRNA ligase n=1 Tax=Micavibrio aeruginosavorus EPB TaxID=349215 RepID=M4VJY1_9BACT|nr:isoleucine--tRNA ligase [Micavibrio aeruginosavorus]AGH98810.1 Isoleucyl-tRNA synthetase [Micavibrio aeruginosavorus EPB]